VTHFLEAAIGGEDAARNNRKPAALYLLAQVIILGEKNFRIEAAESIEARLLEEHEHTGAEGLVQARQILEEVVADVESFIEPAAVAANDVRGHALQIFLLGGF
jgi:hypothetical protein